LDVKLSRVDPSDPAPPVRSIGALAEAAQACRACPLYANATQAVFGEGPSSAPIVLVGEQPGNEEDLSGHPFVGPAGAVLDKALAEAGIDRSRVYVTNAVKHFSWEPRGKRRIHKKPRMSEIKACHPWLGAELTRITPKVTVCMGTTAVQSLLGPKVTIASAKGQVLESAYGPVVVTRHPSSVLRLREKEERRAALDELVADLRRAAVIAKSR
jgi:uracil-DNA glycosylase family protein